MIRITPISVLPLVLLCACGESAPAQQQDQQQQQQQRHAPVEQLALGADAEPAVREARDALTQGRPWQATRLLEPVLRDPGRRTPAAVLLAAHAAARWGGWARAEELLGAEPWLDTLFGGEGRELLARAALARRTPAGDSAAREHARLSLGTAAGGAERGARLVLRARALDRIASRARPPAIAAIGDSAAAAYRDAAALLPDAGDWLRLRAAGVHGSAAERRRLYDGVRSAVARARVPWTEAQALERFGDVSGAQRAYAELGARPAALGLALRLAASPEERDRVRRDLVGVVTGERGTEAARTAVDLLDRTFAPLAPAEQLAVARSAAATGPLARAAAGYAAAFAGGAGDDADRFAYGTLLFRLGRNADAAQQFALVRAGPLVGQAEYQRARALLRAGRGDEATALLRRVLQTRAGDTTAASLALYLLGDLASDAGRDADARAAFRDVARRYPSSALAPTAAFRAAMIAYAAGSARDAARELDALAATHPRSEELLAATYWGGRAWSAAGDAARARAHWQDVIAREPASYYSLLAARRLNRPAWVPPDTVRAPAPPADVADAMRRAALLEELDMDVEARFERDRLLADAAGSVPRLLATAQAFSGAGLASPAIRLAEQALARGAPRSALLYRLLYPLVYADVIRAESAARALDPALVAALIKQESNFTPSATSGAGARGLMQVMPDVGRRIATSMGFPLWDPVLLYQPDVNVRLGTAHLAGTLRQYRAPAYALAAYNAGGSRVSRWSKGGAATDAELFAERIPFIETRDYVRIVSRNREMYRMLYEGRL